MKRWLTYLLLLLLVLAVNDGAEKRHGPAVMAVPEEEQGSLLPGPWRTTNLRHHTSRPSFNVPAELERFGVMEGESGMMDTIPEAEYYQPAGQIPAKEEIRLIRSLSTGPHPAAHGEMRDRRHPIPVFQQYEVSGDRIFSIAFDNDIFSNTDYYYTSGLTFELLHPALSALPSAHLLLPAGRGAVNHYSIRLLQALYTPIDPDKTAIQYDDRPFSSILVVGHSNYSLNSARRLRVDSRLDLGVIGPAALGGMVQKAIHDIEPVGWQNQIDNDLVANYFLQAEKGFAVGSHAEFIARGAGNVGTTFNNISAGASLRVSNASGYFESLLPASLSGAGKNHVNFYLMLSLDGEAVLYDATLQGGWIHPERNVYTLSAHEIRRGVLHASFSAGVSLGWFHLEAEHSFLTPEFQQGRNHMWSRIKTSIRF